MDTNRASLGSETGSRIGDFEHDPFADGDGFGTELMQFPPPPTAEGQQEGLGQPAIQDDRAPEMQEMTGPSLFLARSPKPQATPDAMNVQMTVSDEHV